MFKVLLYTWSQYMKRKIVPFLVFGPLLNDAEPFIPPCTDMTREKEPREANVSEARREVAKETPFTTGERLSARKVSGAGEGSEPEGRSV